MAVYFVGGDIDSEIGKAMKVTFIEPPPDIEGLLLEIAATFDAWASNQRVDGSRAKSHAYESAANYVSMVARDYAKDTKRVKP